MIRRFLLMFALVASFGALGRAQDIHLLGVMRHFGGNPVPSGAIFLSDVNWSMAHNGYGPTERDKSLGDINPGDGTTIKLAGLSYTKGIGVHAPSILQFDLNNRCTRFQASVGVDDEVGSAGSVVFHVWTHGQNTAMGGTEQFNSGTMTGNSATQLVDVDLTGEFELFLQVTDAGDGIAFDHADWGYARTTCTVPTGTPITAGSTDIQTALNAGSVNQTFLARSGMHVVTGTGLIFKQGQTLVGELGSVITGRRLLAPGNTWTNCGTNCWYVGGQTQGSAATPSDDMCWREDGTGGSTFPNGNLYPCTQEASVYIDNVPQIGTLTLGALAPGRFFFDYSTDRIYVYATADPTGSDAQIETELTERAFADDASSANSGITAHISNIVVEKFTGYNASAEPNWTLDYLDVRYGHGTGIYTKDNSVTSHSFVHHMGYQGFGGCCAGAIIQTTENSYNNVAFYNPYQGGGGSKWVNVNGLTVQNNNSHHNFGPGFWTDINNRGASYLNNIVTDNARAGIFHEISYAATISGNVIKRNGIQEAARNGNTYGGCVQVISSPNVVIHDNTCVDNGSGIFAAQDGRTSGAFGATTITGLDVYDNCIEQQFSSYAAALGGAPSYSTAVNNFHHNTYKGPSASNVYGWNNTTIAFAAWQGTYGLDTTGSRSTGSCP